MDALGRQDLKTLQRWACQQLADRNGQGFELIERPLRLLLRGQLSQKGPIGLPTRRLASLGRVGQLGCVIQGAIAKVQRQERGHRAGTAEVVFAGLPHPFGTAVAQQGPVGDQQEAVFLEVGLEAVVGLDLEPGPVG